MSNPRPSRAPKPRRRPAGRLRILLAELVAVAALLTLALAFRLVPDPWNPLAPLTLSEPVTFVTPLKVRLAGRDPTVCRALLGEVGTPAAERREGPSCSLIGGIRLVRLSAASLAPVETRCAIALRLWFWEKEVQEEARARLGTGIARVEHLSSYSCRPMRTTGGETTRLSRHATASAIDISGFVLEDGRRLTLVRDWDGAEGVFLRAAHDAGCRWFTGVLGPDYNALHADHFHFEEGRWPFCR